MHGLSYALYLEERIQAEAKATEIERMTLNIAGYDRWQQLYAPDQVGDQPLSIIGSPLEEVGVDDINEVDRYFDRLNSGATFAMSGADVGESEGWV